MSDRLRAALVFAATLAVLLPFAPAQPVAAVTGYTMETHVRYEVDDTARLVAVTLDVTFTNTTPDANGRLSGFDAVEVAVHEGATGFEAQDVTGPLTVTPATDGVARVSVAMRSRVRYNTSATFTLRYALEDGAPGVHVRPQVVQFTAWAIGTSADVTVRLPADLDVSVAGGTLDPVAGEPPVTLASGPVAEPASWAAVITGTRASTYVTSTASVALAGGTVDLHVSHWPDDPEWGRRTLALLQDALPLLEEAAGLPYPRVGPLVVRESVADPSAGEEPPTAGAEILAAFDQPAFTLLHQAAHIWIDERLAADLWIREGLASHVAAQAARALGVDLPYNPLRRAEELAEASFPLVAWTAPSDAYGHAAAWALTDRIAVAVGASRLRLVLARVAANASAYDPLDPAPLPADGGPVTPLDSRRLLDQLEAVGSTDFASMFAETVFEPEDARELSEREIARFAYEDLLQIAGDWGPPEPIRAAMAAWRFVDARAAITQARGWLEDRDSLVLQVTVLGLSLPERLRDAYRAHGGGVDARAEIDAAEAVVAAYATAHRRVSEDVGPIEQIGLVGGAAPDDLLARAAAGFAAGDLQEAADAIDLALARLDRATSDGLVRISAAMIMLGLIGYAASRVARRSGGSDYTAAQ